ncbi:MAG: PadR family transcriptional regulator, partial [Actinomycetes bacterium]
MLSPPRHFLYPAVLLLLTEEPRHGYLLGETLAGLGLGRMDRPSIYRALADLEADGLVHTWDEAPTAGSTRHVHAVTPKGEQALEAWMSIVAQERNSMDVVLQRYWYCSARGHTASDAGAAQGAGAAGGTTGTAIRPAPGQDAEDPAEEPEPSGRPERFEVKADRSSLTVEARSSVGPIAFSATSLAGWIDVELHEGLVAKDSAPSAHLEVRVTELTSGNA